MKVQLINELKDKYQKDLISKKLNPDPLLRICIANWQQHFSFDELRLAPVLDQALKNKDSGRLWGGERVSIKSSLIELSEHHPDLFREALKDLFNEDKMLDMRIHRFLHHMDIIFRDYRQKNEKADKHQQDVYAASLLLTLQFPNKYCLYRFQNFLAFCEKIGVVDLPMKDDFTRFHKITSAVNKIISKDESFMNTYYSSLEGNMYFGPALDVVNELIEYAAC